MKIRNRLTRLVTAVLLGSVALVAAADEKPAADPAPWKVPDAAVTAGAHPVTVTYRQQGRGGNPT